MDSYQNIIQKLEKFIKKYYSKLLIQGVLLFLLFGALAFMLVLGVEYFLWLNKGGRLFLLFTLIALEGVLLYRYIAVPLLYLFRVRNGLSHKQASVLIGTHFPEVGDKLLNLLDLADDEDKSELLLASIAYRSESLKPVEFSKAINFKESIKNSVYLVVPVIILGIIWLNGSLGDYLGSAQRVVNYDLAYEQPAPFQFQLVTNTLDVLSTETTTIKVTTVGELRPEVVTLVIEDRDIVLKKLNGIFQHTFTPPLRSSDFYFNSNGVTSKQYRLNVLEVPLIQDLKVKLVFPGYTGRSPEVLKGTGNAVIPEGTRALWEVITKNTEQILLQSQGDSLPFEQNDGLFSMEKSIYNDFDYELTTSNKNIVSYETLAYSFNVVKDQYPTIKVKQQLDTINPNVSYFSGQATDDYSIQRIELVCYPSDNKEAVQKINLSNSTSNFEQFYYTFPSGLMLEEQKEYRFYFSVTDNDAIHNGKSSKSQLFSIQQLNDTELNNRELDFQEKLINNLDNSLNGFKNQQKTLNQINQGQKEKNELNFNDKTQISDFLQRQEQQENLMKKFSKELKESIDRNSVDDKRSELLQERLERQEKEADKNAKLLKELNKVADKINKEELQKELEELGKKQKNSERGLEQLLELTKRYYVTEKAKQISEELLEQSKMQEQLSKKHLGEEFIGDDQMKLNSNFEELGREIDDLQKDNQALKKPLSLELKSENVREVKSDQKNALEEIEKQESNQEAGETKRRAESMKSISKKQKSAADKMKEMSEGLEDASAGSSSGSEVAEDAEMLRQILDNLIIFSFKQEGLYGNLTRSEGTLSSISTIVRNQQELRSLFEHVDDSLFALSLRQAELSEFVNKEITEVYYNIDKSLGSLTEGQIYQSNSFQKYVITAANSLADFLVDVLENMNQSMKMGSGQGQSGNGFQLPDIIKKQGELKDKMEGMGSSGKSGSSSGTQGEGKGGESGDTGKIGKEDSSGEEGAGKNGISGDGESGKGSERGNGKGESGTEGKGHVDNGGKGSSGGGVNGQGQSEQELQEFYAIYKDQQRLRNQLEEQLQNMINNNDRGLAHKLVKQMKEFEDDLLENGITQQGLAKINTIEYELLKLKNAAMKQGKKPERESNTNQSDFKNVIISQPEFFKNRREEIELLNRQALPLRQNYQSRVKNYFQEND